MEENAGTGHALFESLLNIDEQIAHVYRKIEKEYRVDPEITCITGRKFLEYVLYYLDSSKRDSSSDLKESSFNLIGRLSESSILPRLQSRWAHSLRDLGNVGSHAAKNGAEANFDDALEVFEVATKLARWLHTTIPAGQRAPQAGGGQHGHEDGQGAKKSGALPHKPSVIAPPPGPSTDTHKATPIKNSVTDISEVADIAKYYRLVICCESWGERYFLVAKHDSGKISSFWIKGDLPYIQKIGKIITNGLHLDVQHIWDLSDNQFVALVRRRVEVVYGAFYKLCWMTAGELRRTSLDTDSRDGDTLRNALALFEGLGRGKMPNGGAAVRKSEFVWRG